MKQWSKKPRLVLKLASKQEAQRFETYSPRDKDQVVRDLSSQEGIQTTNSSMVFLSPFVCLRWIWLLGPSLMAHYCSDCRREQFDTGSGFDRRSFLCITMINWLGALFGANNFLAILSEHSKFHWHLCRLQFNIPPQYLLFHIHIATHARSSDSLHKSIHT